MSTAAVTAPPLSERKPIYNSLFVQVVAGLVLGIIFVPPTEAARIGVRLGA